jgi:hypothetical protein
MKKIISLLLMSVVLTTFTFGAVSNKTGGGSNYYQTANLIGKTLPALGAIGGNALVYIDASNEDDAVVSSLTSAGYTVTFASDWSNFNTLLAGGTDLAVAFAQSYSANYGGLSASVVQNYISGGGRMIFATWNTDDYNFANLFQATFTGNENMNVVSTIYHPISNGLDNKSFTLTNPAWGTYSLGLSPLTGGVVVATFENGDGAMILGNNGRTMMLGYLSDTPPSSLRGGILLNVVTALDKGVVVPIPYIWIILAFVLIAGGVVFAKRKVIFS